MIETNFSVADIATELNESPQTVQSFFDEMDEAMCDIIRDCSLDAIKSHFESWQLTNEDGDGEGEIADGVEISFEVVDSFELYLNKSATLQLRSYIDAALCASGEIRIMGSDNGDDGRLFVYWWKGGAI